MHLRFFSTLKKRVFSVRRFEFLICLNNRLLYFAKIPFRVPIGQFSSSLFTKFCPCLPKNKACYCRLYYMNTRYFVQSYKLLLWLH